MKLKRGTRVVVLTNEAQIAAYKNAGFEEVKDAPKKAKSVPKTDPEPEPK